MHLPHIGVQLSSLSHTMQPAFCNSLMKTECASFKAAYPFLCLVSNDYTARVFSLLDSSSSCAIKCATRIKWYSIGESPRSTAYLSIFTEDCVVSILRIDSSRGKITLSKVVFFTCSASLAPIEDFFTEHAYGLLCASKNGGSYFYHVKIEERSFRVYDLSDAFIDPKVCLLGALVCMLDQHGLYKFQESSDGLTLLSFERFPSALVSYRKMANGFIVAVRSATGFSLIDSFTESEAAFYDSIEASSTKRLYILNSLSLIAFDKDVSDRIEMHSSISKLCATIQMSRPISTKDCSFSATAANGRVLLFSYSNATKEITVDHVYDPSFPSSSYDFATDYKRELNECFALFKKHIEGVYSTCTILFLFLACSTLLSKLNSFCNTELLKNDVPAFSFLESWTRSLRCAELNSRRPPL